MTSLQEASPHFRSGRNSTIQSPLIKAKKFENEKMQNSNFKNEKNETNASIDKLLTQENEISMWSNDKSNHEKQTKERKSSEKTNGLKKNSNQNEINLMIAANRKKTDHTKAGYDYFKEVKSTDLKDVANDFQLSHIAHFKGMKTVALVGNNCQLILLDTDGYFKEKLNLFKMFVETNGKLQGYDYVTNDYEGKDLNTPAAISKDKVKSFGRNMLRDY